MYTVCIFMCTSIKIGFGTCMYVCAAASVEILMRTSEGTMPESGHGTTLLCLPHMTNTTPQVFKIYHPHMLLSLCTPVSHEIQFQLTIFHGYGMLPLKCSRIQLLEGVSFLLRRAILYGSPLHVWLPLGR